MIKLALTGQLRAGKDAVADYLWLTHGFGKVAFGAELKRQYHALLPWIPKEPKPRAGYQKFGQLVRQEFGEDVWVRHAAEAVAFYENQRSTSGIVISDLRQPNELAWCRANGFVIIRVTAPEELRIARAIEAGDAFEAADLAHDTESHTAGFAVDYELVNDGSIDDLRTKVDAVLAEIRPVIQPS